MPPLLNLNDPSDPRLDPYRDLRRPDSVARRLGFIVEGRLALERAVRSSRHPLQSVLVADTRVASLAHVLDGLPQGVAVYRLTQAAMDELCGYCVHRGLLAHGREREPPTADALLASLVGPAAVLGLVGINDGENMGALLRNAAAFGAGAVLLDPSCCDPLSRRAIRVSLGAALMVPVARLSAGEDMVRSLRDHGFEVLALTPRGEQRLDEVEGGPRTALLLGAEGPGLPQDILAAARTVRISMTPGFDSLNVAATSAVALHHLATQGRQAPLACGDCT